jgi:hypothetical protein
MATSRTVATPGQDPNTNTDDTGATAAGTGQAGASAGTGDAAGDVQTGSQATPGQAETALQAQLDEMKAAQQALIQQNAAMAEQLKQLLAAGLRTAQAQAAAPAPLPSIDDKAVRASTVPVLTKDGWFVPESKVWQVTAGAKGV